MNVIEIKNFSKKYESVEAVKSVSFSVRGGELFGLIGPDGAGKTTLMRAICTLLVPDAGEIWVKGLEVTRNIANIRKILGYMPQRFSLYQDLSVEQNLRFFADIFQVPMRDRKTRMQQLYQFSRLGPFKKRTAAALSGGMKQKLALSCALIHTPDILILDEPTFGVDPVSRQEFWEILHEIRSQGTTILVSTAYMDEADQCDRVALFFKGQIIAMDTPDHLKQNYQFPLFQIEGKDLHDLRNFFHSLPEVRITQLFGDAIHVSFSQPPQDDQWRQWQQLTGNLLKRWQKINPTIEDIFLDLTREDHAE